MCGICGCAEGNIHDHHEDGMGHALHAHLPDKIIHLEHDLLAKNNQLADTNREYFLKNKIRVINLMSSPGSGKTTLLARTVAEWKQTINMAVIVGDQQTDYDAQKLKQAGVEAIQINTGKVCHLDAHMVAHSVEKLSLKENTILFVENVGNLVCPALFDLGETDRVVILSVTEGDNKPLKYPNMFRQADVMILTKMDLLPYVEFDVDNCIEYAKRIQPAIRVINLSATTGAGLTPWYQWLAEK